MEIDVDMSTSEKRSSAKAGMLSASMWILFAVISAVFFLFFKWELSWIITSGAFYYGVIRLLVSLYAYWRAPIKQPELKEAADLSGHLAKQNEISTKSHSTQKAAISQDMNAAINQPDSAPTESIPALVAADAKFQMTSSTPSIEEKGFSKFTQWALSADGESISKSISITVDEEIIQFVEINYKIVPPDNIDDNLETYISDTREYFLISYYPQFGAAGFLNLVFSLTDNPEKQYCIVVKATPGKHSSHLEFTDEDGVAAFNNLLSTGEIITFKIMGTGEDPLGVFVLNTNDNFTEMKEKLSA